MHAAGFALLTLVSSAFAANLQANLVMLNDYPLARCLDGTQGGYYFLGAQTATSQNKWIIHFEGGGECVAQNTCDSALTNQLGSSKYFPQQQWLGFLNVPFQKYNPDLWDWNHVLIEYCTQDLHSGQRTTATNETFGLYFSGKHVTDAVIKDLVTKSGLGKATDIIISGDSAGGIATWYYLDAIAAQFPSARVVGAPIAGFYFPAYPYTGPDHTTSYLAPFYPYALQGNYDLWDSFVNQDCAAANPGKEGMCLVANYSFPYIKSNVFITEAQTDQVVLTAHDWVPGNELNLPEVRTYITEWAKNMSIGLQQVIYSGNTCSNGVFNPACFIHTSFNNTLPSIQGQSYITTFGNWYFKRGGPCVLQDDCGIFCGKCP